MNYLTFEVKEGREMYVVPVKSKVEISQNFVAFSECMNFTVLMYIFFDEKVLAKLPEIAQRFEHFYCDKYGKENVSIIKNSNIVEQSKLDPSKAYIQITFVEPYFDDYEMRDRVTAFEQNFNISKTSV